MLVKSKIKYIQSLGQKKFRDSEKMYIAEGPKIVGELLLEIPDQITAIYALKDWIEQYESWKDKIEIIEITESELLRISHLQTPNTVLAQIKQHEQVHLERVPDNVVTLMLDNIQDPGNLGTIIRTADWFGISNIICSKSTADLYNPKVVQSAMGSIARVKVQYEELLPVLENSPGIPVFAAVLEGADVRTLQKISKAIIIIGNESKGINTNILSYVTNRITIPGKGGAESLNAAVAAGIILSHLT